MSEQLKQFLAEWLAWAEADAPVHPVFTAHYGLCANLDWWSEYDYVLEDELAEMFDDNPYPFGGDAYRRDKRFNTQHRNPDRLAWVRKQLGVA